MLILPAIDLRGGRVVRLTQGDYERMTVYGDDPASTARGFEAAGAAWLHMVDLDGAKDGNPQNRAVIAQVCGGGLKVEVGGGMRSERDVQDTLALGVSRVILGTLALTDFALLKRLVARYGERIAVGVDARDGCVATHGWLRTSDTPAVGFCATLRDAGVRTVIYTDISRDGRLAGANLEVYQALCTLEGLDIVASGGVSTLEDIAALRDLGLYGCILGKALYAGRLDLGAAIAMARSAKEAGAC
ncbi:MAG TPA: 1-(5-phosphoribosyl)-5-[(5-phosphoribosylamino)methylideneamino]imidazole-4-carboxamide isomerase [Candidatus Limiplasma stercoravium]|nr:1-(5-phosphoribosyl)-5-[(5-phosphoribosylamino)methylideneamino]imidazole-4-carboxamide isomerase [Candidatus Limiplasma stercoravium]